MIGRVVLDKEYVQCMGVLRGTIPESALVSGVARMALVTLVLGQKLQNT